MFPVEAPDMPWTAEEMAERLVVEGGHYYKEPELKRADRESCLKLIRERVVHDFERIFKNH